MTLVIVGLATRSSSASSPSVSGPAAGDGGEHGGLGGGEVAVAGLAELAGETGDGQAQAAGQLGGLVGDRASGTLFHLTTYLG